MSRVTLPIFSYPHTFSRPLPNVLSQQSSSSANGPIPVSGTSIDAGGLAGSGTTGSVLDTHILLSLNTENVDTTVAAIGKVAHVAVFANQPCEIRLLFHGAAFATGALQFAALLQVQDYPPLFVPNDTTKWTVYRNIVLHDRYFLALVANLGGAQVSNYRIDVTITDRTL